MSEEDSFDRVTVNKYEMPPYLRTGCLFLSLESPDATVKVPKGCYKPDLTLQSQSDVKLLLETMKHWGVKNLPGELVAYLLQLFADDAKTLLAPYSETFPFAEFLIELCSFVEGTGFFVHGCGEYVPIADLQIQETVLSNVLSLLKWQFQFRHGKVWNSETCALAAQIGWLDCLQFLHELGCPWDSTTCSDAARCNRLECLRYAHTHGCPWDRSTTILSLRVKSFDCFRYALENGCPVDEVTLSEAAAIGDIAIMRELRSRGCRWTTQVCAAGARAGLQCVMWLREQGCPWDDYTCIFAAEAGNLECLKYAHGNGCPLFEDVCAGAARYGHLDCLQYAHQHGCEWGLMTAARAAESGSLQCLEYAHRNGCSWEYGYEVFHYAIEGGHVDCLRYALDNNCPDSFEILYLAAGSLASLKFLHGERKMPLTPFVVSHCAGGQGCMDTLKYCIDQGCAVDASTLSAAANQLDRLKYLRERECPWDQRALANSVYNLDCLRYLLDSGCPGRETICKSAAWSLPSLKLVQKYGCPLLPEAYIGKIPLECVRFLFDNGVPWPKDACATYAGNHDLQCLQFAHEHGAPWDKATCAAAAHIPYGRYYAGWGSSVTAKQQADALLCLQYLHEQGCPWDATTYRAAKRECNKPCLDFALAHGCPSTWVRDKLRGVVAFVMRRNKQRKTCKACAKVGVREMNVQLSTSQGDQVHFTAVSP